MRIGAMPETMLERLALGVGLVPTPLIDTSGTFILARMVIAANRIASRSEVGLVFNSHLRLAGVSR